MLIVPIAQNVDRVAKLSDYSHLQPNQLLVHNTFFTLQGEGPYSGLPALFVRLAGCNFGNKSNVCRGCDTNFNLDEGKVKSFDQLKDEFVVLTQEFNGYYLVVITGGEPCLQKSLPNFVAVLVAEGKTVQLETNGMFPSVANACVERGAVIVCSPKASLSRGYGGRPSIQGSDVFYKFVVTHQVDDPHHKLPEWALDPQLANRVFVSPLTVYKKAYEGEVSSVWDSDLVDQEATKNNYAYAAELAVKHNLRLSVQLHTLTSQP